VYVVSEAQTGTAPANLPDLAEYKRWKCCYLDEPTIDEPAVELLKKKIVPAACWWNSYVELIEHTELDSERKETVRGY